MKCSLKKPCSNCPFLKVGAIDLRPGRVDGIKAGLLKDDWQTFQCHKTLGGPKAGTWEDDAEGEPVYRPSGSEEMCAGAMIWLAKQERPSILMRLCRVDFRALREAQGHRIID